MATCSSYAARAWSVWAWRRPPSKIVTSADEPSAARPAAKISAPAQPSDAKPNEKDGKSPASNATVDQLIEQLDAADFAKREAACGDLAAKGRQPREAADLLIAAGFHCHLVGGAVF